ncbi:HAD-IA family hydrolase [Nanohaloarchaea archaeon]|nr:HAD-IA family hydrolase [Candidatus Nanohaloarchaea archaeon]
MRYGSVIFDMDGVLLNSLVDDERWKYDAVKQALSEQGLEAGEVPRRDLRRFLGDFGRQECINVCDEYGLEPDRVWELVAETTNLARIEKVKEGEFEIYDDARGFLEALHPRDLGLGVISNAPEAAVKTTMQFFEMEHYFSYYRGVESFEDLKKRKPHPKHLKIAQAELKKSPFLYIGDEPSDIKAAESAGMSSALVERNTVEEEINPDFRVQNLKVLGRELGVL